MGIVQNLYEEQGHLVRKRHQPERGIILDEVKRRRQDRTARDLSFARPALTIPDLDYERLCTANPDLRSPDGGIKTRAWTKFMQSAESKIYRNFDRI